MMLAASNSYPFPLPRFVEGEARKTHMLFTAEARGKCRKLVVRLSYRCQINVICGITAQSRQMNGLARRSSTDLHCAKA